VRPDDYRAFTSALVDGLSADPRVVGVVAVGSMAERDYAPDEWSDHDFFVVTAPEEQEAFRSALDWLPRAAAIALSYRETAHGLKVLLDDGHLLEFAVFDVDELALAGVNRYRVLLDRGGVEERLAATAAARAAAREDESFLFGQLLTAVLVGAGRDGRGEALSGAFFVKGLAVRHLLALLARAVPSERAGLLDDLDPFRRFEQVHPGLAREVEGCCARRTVEAGLGLLDLAEREARPHLPKLPWAALGPVRQRLSSAGRAPID
jgi:predicted nucleotidyltransferase